MAAPVSVLLSAPADTGAGRFITALKASGYAPRAVLVSSEAAFQEALPRERWDVVILVPGTLPITQGITAVQQAHAGVPVVIAEAPAGAESRLREAGADAVVASGELERLGQAVSDILAAAPPAPPGLAPGADPRALAVQDLAEHLPIGLYQTRPDGRIVYANEALPLVLGFDSREELADIDVRQDIGYPRDHFEAQMARFGSVRNLVVRWTDRTGRKVFTREHARAVRDAEGNVAYFEGTMEDVTAEYTAREREARRTSQFATVVRFATEVDDAETIEDVFTAAVAAAESVTGARLILLEIDDGESVRCVKASGGASERELIDAAEKGLFAGVPIGTAPVILSDLREGRPAEVNEELRGLLLSKGIGGFAIYPLIYHGSARGAILACYGEVHSPVDEEVQVVQSLAWHVAGAIARHEAEAGLRASEACLRFIDRHTDHVLFRLRYGPEHGTSTFDYLSPAVEALVGYSTSELDELGGLATLVEEREVIEGGGLTDGPPSPEAFHVDGTPPRYVARYRMRTKDDETLWVENVAYVWTEADGRPVGLVGTLVDVTERKCREEAAAAEAARTLELQRTLVELGAMGAVDTDAFIRRVTEAATEAIGVDRALVRVSGPDGEGRCLDLYDAVAGEHVDEADLPAEQFEAWLDEHGRSRSIALVDTLVDPRSLSTQADSYFRDKDIGAILSAAIRHQGRVAGVLSLQHLGGPRVWTNADLEFAAALADLLAIALERSDRVRAEKALRDQELRYRAVSELTSDYAFAVRIHPDGRDEIDWATGAFARVTGYSADEVGAISGLLALFHPECVSVVRNALALLDAGEAVDFEARIRTKLGQERWVRHRARPGKPEADGTVVHYHGGEDVTDRKRFEQELIAAREQAEEMARLKSAFLANMSHEIRTPLTGILGYAGVLADEVTEAEHRESVEFIERSGHRLLETLDSVLELARLEANGVRPHAEVLDVALEARLSAQLLAPVAEAKGIKLEVVGTGPAYSRLDRACLARILNNLIGNAVKFTEAGGVEVEILADETHAHIRIADTGVGIDEHFLPRIFDEFRQESDGDARHHEGAGLGLAITRRLVDVLGGAVAVESEKGVGTTVIVTFPLHEPPPQVALPPPLPDSESSIIEEPATLDLAESTDLEHDEDLEAVLPDYAAHLDSLEPMVQPATLLDSLDDADATDLPDVAQVDAGDSQDADGQLLDLIFPSDEGSGELEEDLSLAWAEEDQGSLAFPMEEGDGAWLDGADASLEALFAPISLHMPEDPDQAPEPPIEPVPGLAFETGDGVDAGDGLDVSLAGPLDDSEHEVHVSVPPPLTSNAMDAAMTDGNGSAAAHPPDLNDARPAANGPSVLVVEDNSDTRALLERILRSGYTTFAVGDARSALDLLHRERFDALVLDINLGGRETGVDVLRIARSLPGNEGLFAIALTAYALPGDRERFLEAGFDQYVSKPFTRTTLLAALREGLGEIRG